MKRTTLFSFGDRFTNPDKEWVVVASESVMRAYILRYNFNIQNVLTMRSGFSENLDKSQFSNVGEYVRATADGKARIVARRIFNAFTQERKDEVLRDLNNPFGEMPANFNISKIVYVIGADTVCDLNGTIYEKPKDREEAKMQISSYQKHNPLMTTGVAAYARQHGCEENIFSFYDVTKAYFQTMTEEDIEAYLDLNEWVGISGSCKITGYGQSVIERIEGCYTTSVGMPAHKLSQHFCQYLNLLEA